MINKKQLGEFDSLTIFNNEYLLVERNGLYNLIDNAGAYVSKTWYKEIKKNDGGGADFFEKDSERPIQARTISSLGTYQRVRSMISSSANLKGLDLRCVVVVTPFTIVSRTSRREVTIVAKVKLFNTELYLAKNGKLYTSDHTEFNLPEFFVSPTDIARLVEWADEFNLTYLPAYDINNKKGVTHACWIFGFNADNMIFHTSRTNVVGASDVEPWGGNTIKCRFNPDVVPEQYRNAFVAVLDGMGYHLAHFDNGQNLYTKLYKYSQMDVLFSDIKRLCDKKSLIQAPSKAK